MKKYTLFIDESGNLDLKNKISRYYILCGCAIAQGKQTDLKTYADQIKFKYWGRTDIVFHSREIKRNEGDFFIFKDKPELKNLFMADLLDFLSKAQIIIFPIVVDKASAVDAGWDYIKVIKETSRQIMLNFINLLLTMPNVYGHIIIESAHSDKDRYYLNSFSEFLSPECKDLQVDYKQMQKTLTSLSFVTKNNHDIEEQLADLFAYSATCMYLADYRKKVFTKDSYEDQMVKILEKKLFIKPTNSSKAKMEHFKEIDSFCVLPRISESANEIKSINFDYDDDRDYVEAD